MRSGSAAEALAKCKLKYQRNFGRVSGSILCSSQRRPDLHASSQQAIHTKAKTAGHLKWVGHPSAAFPALLHSWAGNARCDVMHCQWLQNKLQQLDSHAHTAGWRACCKPPRLQTPHRCTTPHCRHSAERASTSPARATFQPSRWDRQALPLDAVCHKCLPPDLFTSRVLPPAGVLLILQHATGTSDASLSRGNNCPG